MYGGEIKKNLRRDWMGERRYFYKLTWWLEGADSTSFQYGITNVDLEGETLQSIGQDLVQMLNPDVDLDSLVVRMDSFNNIEV